MKKIITLITVVCISLTVSAQYFYFANISAGTNPGGLNNDSELPGPAGWTTIHFGSAAVPAWTAAVNIPFAFSFNGAPVTQFKVSTSGVLTFDVATVLPAPSYTRAALPNASIPNSSVCIWGLGGLGPNDIIITKTFGTAPNRQFWVQFNSYGYGGTTPSADFDYTYWGIVLAETSNYIYIVDQRTAGFTGQTMVSAGIQINSTSAYAITGSPNLAATATSLSSPADNSYYTFIQGTLPNWDFTVLSESVADHFLVSGSTNVTGSLKNMGGQTVTSFTMNYSVNGGPTVSGSIGPVSIAPNATYNFTHPVPLTVASSNVYSVQTWASDLNGNPDAVTANDNLTFSVGAADLFVTRQTCLEVFTSVTCPPCAPANAHMEANVIPVISNFTVIKYQQDFPGAGDPYRYPEAVSRRTYYGINSIPRMEIDGQWNQNAAAISDVIFNNFQAIPSPISIDITSATYTGTTVNVTGNITPHLNHAVGTYRYHVVVVEKQTTGNYILPSAGGNGETEFYNVMMNMEPNQNGTAISALVSGTAIPFTKTIANPSALPNSNACCHIEDMADLRVVVFVQSNTDKKILQSGWQDVLFTTDVAEVDAQGEGIASVYPNPVNHFATIKLQLTNSTDANVTVSNVMGQVVYQNDLGMLSPGITKHSLNTENLAEGIYNVTVKAGDKLFTHKFVIGR